MARPIQVVVGKKVRSEIETVVVDVSGGEYLQYWISSSSSKLRFTLVDVRTHEIILSEQAPAAQDHPPTYTRLWPLVGDRPQRESSLMLAISMLEGRQKYRLKVLLKKTDGRWETPIDVDFEATDAGDQVLYPFKVRAE